MQRLRNRGNKGDGPPVLSQEFIIQNHADIISCICMLIFMMLIPQVTNPIASTLIFVHNNVTIQLDQEQDMSSVRLDNRPQPVTFYQHGKSDLLNVAFYSLVWIIIHALIQEYIWERTVKRLHLSKTKTSKYYDSGCLVVFYFVSAVWGMDIILKSGYASDPTHLWRDYPHTLMILSLKFFMLTQMAFWLHCYPELIFMKTRKEEIYYKLVLYTSSFLITAGAYFMMLQRLAVVLLVLHYITEFFFHACRLLHYHGRKDISQPGFKLWQGLFVLSRILTVVISIITWFGIGTGSGLKEEEKEEMEVAVEGEEEEGDIEGKIFPFTLDLTQPTYRLGGLLFVLLIQLWIGYTFLSSQWERASQGDKGFKNNDDSSRKPSRKNTDKKSSGKPGKTKSS